MRARVNGVDVAYTDAGQGEAVLLIHGFPLDRTMWDAQVEALAGTRRVIAPDLGGFGESEARSEPVSMEAFADDVRGLLDHLGLPRAVIGGLSMGGYVAFAFARKYAERTRALILCDTRAGADSPEARAGRAEMAALARARGLAPIADRMLPRLLAPATRERRPDVVERVRRMILRAPVAGVVAALGGMAERPDATPGLPAIGCPVLFIVGRHDVISPPAEAEAICAKLPRARRVVIPDAGHLAPMENAAAVNAAIGEFLSPAGGAPPGRTAGA